MPTTRVREAREDALALEGTGWEGDLDAMHGDASTG